MSASKDKDTTLVPTVREVQQKFAEILSHGEDITWDLLTLNQTEVLKRKLSMFKANTNMFYWIWDQRKYTNGQSLTSLFFVMIVDNVSNPQLAEESRSWHLYPVFRCRRCVDKTGQASSIDCCMAYVTQNSCCGNWKEFLLLPDFRQGLMVTPHRGVYKLIDGQVELKSYSITDRPCSGLLPKIKDYSITPDSLALASKTLITRKKPKNVFDFPLVFEFCTCERMLSLLLNPDSEQQSCDIVDLSDSLVLFTDTVNNFRLASRMIKEVNCASILINQQRSVFDKISEEAARIEGKVDIIRSANGVPEKVELDNLFQPIQKKRKLRKLPETPMNIIDVPDSPEITTINVKGEDINLEVYGMLLREHIVSLETFEILITSMSEHLEPETFKLILQLTQTFVENTREEMCQLLKYYFSTESVLYQIILSIRRYYPRWDFDEIEEQSSEILRRLRYFFASSDPNSRIEFLKKCDKCVGYYDLFNNN
ncbi:uncharacterized protein [Drosophila suzukii]|uniref:Uncharacterized protein isoform X1 n=3 Tax=Drosophila suzukii TaxID=28584 RepID=A0AB40A4L2_DROSZ